MRKIKMHPAQQDVFTDQCINIESPHYNLGLYLSLNGSLDLEKFREAVISSPCVFDAFKMRFDTSEPELSCYMDEDFNTLELKELDFSTTIHPEEFAKKWMQEQFNIPFVLQKENPLSNQALIKLSTDHHLFYFKFHHLIIDAYGFVNWINFISNKYNSLVNNIDFIESYPLYSAEITKAAEYHNSVHYKKDGNYWKNKIREKPENLLHKKYKRSKNTAETSSNFYITLDKDFRELLSELQRTTKSNPQQLLIAALLVYYKQTTTETEFSFGIPFHKREGSEQRNIVGMFSGILPYKQVLDKDVTLNDLLFQIKKIIKEDYPHRQYLISDLSRSLQSNISQSYLCDVLINYVPFNFNLNFGEKISADIHWLLSEFERSGLQLCLRDYTRNQPLELGLHYSTEYFDKVEIELFAKRILSILLQFPAALTKDIESINILPDEEEQLLQGFNKPISNYTVPKTIVSCFKEQAILAPDSIAVVFEQQQCTYKELDVASEKLACYLRGKGVKTETLIPICVERGVEMIVGILGILKCGAAYVPIDPENPVERIKYIVEDVKSSIIISSKKSRVKVGSLENVTTILVDDEWPEIALAMAEKLPVVNPCSLAYVIYTSGSTGEPKGVMVEHRSFINLNNAYHKIKANEHTILTCNYVFDVSVLEIFSALLSGACLHIPTYSTVSDPAKFAAFLIRKKISTAYIHPMYLSEVSSVLSQHNECFLTKILIGVEPISNEVVHWYLDKNVSIINGYGPTETTICATFYAVDKIGLQQAVLPIGKPIENYEILIVSSDNKIAPVGVAGEIYIGGLGLARGYLNRPDLTAEKFVENHFIKDKGRLYKTGDVGRWGSDGNIEFIGRADNQVKIRGYRIELGEIESILLQSKLVKQCVVMARDDNEGNKRLVGYIVPNVAFCKEAILVHLKSKLPAYMVPSSLVELDALPLTKNGKVNRKALPEPDYNNISTEKFVEPRNKLETKLAGIWKKLLHLEKVGIYDNFFTSGGHSLLAVQLINYINKETGKNILISELVQYSTIEKLAKFIDDNKKNKRSKFLVPLKTEGNKIPLYIVCGAGGTALAFYQFVHLLAPNQPVYVLQQPTEVQEHEKSSFESVEDLAERYIDDILVENPSGPYALSGHCMGGIIAFEIAKQLTLKGKEVKFLAMFDSIVPQREQSNLITGSSSNLKNSISKMYSKIEFEFFLLFNHTRHAIAYKKNSLKTWGKNLLGLKQKQEHDVFKKSEQAFQAAISRYKLDKFNGEVFAFYAKEHYEFVDRNRNITYKKIVLENSIKNRWKHHAALVTMFEVDGEHSTIFDPAQGNGFADLLQHLLDFCSNS